MRPRDPRALVAKRREATARVQIVQVPQAASSPDGAASSTQAARVTLPRAELDRLWTPEYLERLARTYWRFLNRASLGLLRIRYAPDSRDIVFLGRPFVLIGFKRPEYEIESDYGSVTWRIVRGLLVAPRGRGKGYLKISVMRPPVEHESSDEVTVNVTSEVRSFYPMIAGWGWFAAIGRELYKFTQLRIHVIVTNAFLRSLARLDLERSVVGALSPPDSR
jgi:hypothetical protein